MSLKKRLLALLPSNKWCGCDRGVEEETSYQFRVRAESDDVERNLFQVRAKHVCTGCDDDRVETLVEDECNYDPSNGTPHERRVGVDDNEMVNYGFQSQDEMARMLIEMRLADSLEPHSD